MSRPTISVCIVSVPSKKADASCPALFPTTSIPYRRLGWELVGTLRWTAEPRDVPAILELYTEAAAAGTGMLTRRGALFQTTPEALLSCHDGYSVAEQNGAVVGCCSWDRGPGYDADAHLSVPDLFARTPEGLGALLAMLGSGAVWPRPCTCGCDRTTRCTWPRRCSAPAP